MGKAIAVKGCTITVNGGAVQPPTGQFTIKTEADSNVQADGKDCYFGEVEVIIPTGSTSPAGVLSSPVTVKISPTGSNASTDKGDALLMGDKSSGEDTGTFVQGTSSTDVPLLVVIADAVQSVVTLE